MISQRKRGFIHSQKSCNKRKSQSSKRSDPFCASTEYNQMTGYDAFDTTNDLEDFEEVVFGFEEDPLHSRKDSFMETFFDFDVGEPSAAGNEVNVDDTINAYPDE
ncbi:hypothetical protein O181_039730 [Austropuccinia psidii MF-1]|uniref:Uncharacterized protein n=1 Tax=Austropuccinia psidii MF-1 TaxID=1389203 RepID=A0A9Q3DFF1_9BASI|nr:hypothetical protein [Austropuccinia psidii MF-1]